MMGPRMSSSLAFISKQFDQDWSTGAGKHYMDRFHRIHSRWTLNVQYNKDGYYCLMIAEGGTELAHHEAIARSKNISGSYEGYSGNPFPMNTNTTECFQNVGHAGLFQDASGNWWG